MSKYQIEIDATETTRFAQVIAELVRQGICFEATLSSNETMWIITCTGGY